jgi:hypothetical protein
MLLRFFLRNRYNEVPAPQGVHLEEAAEIAL